MARRAAWFWVGLAAGVAAACRAHDAVCIGADCERAPGLMGGAAGADAGGAAGAAAVAEAGEAGQGEPGCIIDDDCDNGVPCDGRERCGGAGCEPGEPVECDHGTSCERETGSCVYRRPSPWLLVNHAGGVDGLPVGELGKRPLLELWRDPRPEPWSSVALRWSRDGRVALFVKHEGQLAFSYWSMRFGAGVPSELSPLRDVPNLLSSAEGPDISTNSRYALSFDAYTGSFLTSLLDDDPTHLVATAKDGIRRVRFCASGSAWLEEYVNGAAIGLLDGEDVRRRELSGSGGAVLSKDRRLLVSPLSDAVTEAAWVLEPCSHAATWRVELPAVTGASFSDDGLLVLLELASGEQKLLNVERADEPVELCHGDGASPKYLPLFSAAYSLELDRQTRPMLATQAGALVVVDAMACDAPPRPLGLPVGVELARAGERTLVGSSQLLAWLKRDDGSRDLLLQSFDPASVPRVVMNVSAAGDSALFVDPQEPELVWVVTAREGRSTIASLQLDAPEAEVIEQLQVEGIVSTLEPAPDESGLALVIDGSAYWTAANPITKYEEPVRLAESVSAVAMQPR